MLIILRKYIFLTLSLCFLVTSLHAEKFKTFKPDNGYFKLKAPKSFQLNELAGYGEYTAFMFDKKYDWDAFVEKGSGEFECALSFRVEALDYQSAEMQAGEVLGLFVSKMAEQYQADGITIDFGRPEEFWMGDVSGVRFELIQKEVYERSLMFIGVHKGMFYSLLVSHMLSSLEAKMQAEKIFDSFELGTLTDDFKKKTIEMSDGSLSIRLPKKWHVKHEQGQYDLRLFVSESKVKDEERFDAGVRIRKFQGLDVLLKQDFKNNTERFSLLLKEASAPTQRYSRKLRFANWLSSTDGRDTYLAEINNKHRKSGIYFTSVHYFIFKDKTVFQIIMEAPTLEFEKYRPVFDDAIQSVVIY